MHIGGYSANRERALSHFRPDRAINAVNPGDHSARDQVGQLRKSSLARIQSSQEYARRHKGEKTGREEKKEKRDALSAPQIAVYVSRGVGYGNLLVDSRRRRGHRSTDRIPRKRS